MSHIVCTVTAAGATPCFVWRHRRLRQISAFHLPLGVTIQVYRKGRLIDRGKVIDLMGQDKRHFFGDLLATTPTSEKFYRDSVAGGVARELFPSWFQVDDQIKLSVSPPFFHALLRERPEYFT